MRRLGAGLVGHARRLLVGTELSVDDALAVAAGEVSNPGIAASALRDGWAAAEQAGVGGRSK
ncbi:hypothetical protein [Propionicimonas sp.]|uniref:hypothetical protein n=1 Tax=Propionicimonas sp. TaxID=1955623 RepID=UPI0017DD1692|nr:hypothetical protein [Propionicimonas sp.]MBA3019612.1 hypothetical protein [Propionicimonas sp.]MBU4411503.1 hypothetical protein [Actinomycetota bacterium]